MDDLRTELSIDGSWRAAEDQGRFAVHEPATGDELASVADATIADALPPSPPRTPRPVPGRRPRRASVPTYCAAPSS